jgi:hypothetical protein
LLAFDGFALPVAVSRWAEEQQNLGRVAAILSGWNDPAAAAGVIHRMKDLDKKVAVLDALLVDQGLDGNEDQGLGAQILLLLARVGPNAVAGWARTQDPQRVAAILSGWNDPVTAAKVRRAMTPQEKR